MSGAAPVAPDDGEILTLFHQWVAAQREADRLLNVHGSETSEYEAQCNALDDLDAGIFNTPAAGTIGMAVKLYVMAHYEFGSPSDTPALRGWDKDDGDEPERILQNHGYASLLRDAARFVPEIGELASALIKPKPTRVAKVVPLRPPKS